MSESNPALGLEQLLAGVLGELLHRQLFGFLLGLSLVGLIFEVAKRQRRYGPAHPLQGSLDARVTAILGLLVLTLTRLLLGQQVGLLNLAYVSHCRFVLKRTVGHSIDGVGDRPCLIQDLGHLRAFEFLVGFQDRHGRRLSLHSRMPHEEDRLEAVVVPGIEDSALGRLVGEPPVGQTEDLVDVLHRDRFIASRGLGDDVGSAVALTHVVHQQLFKQEDLPVVSGITRLNTVLQETEATARCQLTVLHLAMGVVAGRADGRNRRRSDGQWNPDGRTEHCCCSAAYRGCRAT